VHPAATRQSRIKMSRIAGVFILSSNVLMKFHSFPLGSETGVSPYIWYIYVSAKLTENNYGAEKMRGNTKCNNCI
jgi:hypothetical protein